MQFIAHDLNVRAFCAKHFPRCFSHRLPKCVVLTDDVNLLDVGLALHEVGQRGHLDIGVGVPPVMPVAALLVGQRGVDCSVIKVQNLFARIAFVIFRNEIRDRDRCARTISLRDETDA